MLKRRDFITRSAASMAGAALPTNVSSSESRGLEETGTCQHRRMPFDAVIVDARYSDSRRFAAVLQQQGARIIDTREDLGLLWYGALGAAFRNGPQRIAGLTPHSDLFICDSFGREHGVRLIYEGAHDCRGEQVLSHALRLGAPLAGLAAELQQARAHWPVRLAQRIDLADRTALPSAREHVFTRTRRAADHPGMLFSWAIA